MSIKGYLFVIIGLVFLVGVYTQEELILKKRPVVDSVSHDELANLVNIYGENFGYVRHVVNVVVDDLSHRVLAINDSRIVCKKNPRHGDYNDSPLSVYVEVDGQNTTTVIDNKQAVEAAAGSGVVDKEGVSSTANQDTPMHSKYSQYYQNKVVTGVFVGAFVGVVALVVILFLVVRKRKMLAAAAPKANVDAKPKSEIILPTHSIMVRDSSMEEIDLNSIRPTVTEEQQPERPDSPDSISCSSTYSSASCTPGSLTPDGPSSPTTHHRERSEAREKMMSTRVGLEPMSRIGKQSLGSPYTHRQSGFDSPLASSQGITPGRTPLSNSGYLQQGFDSPLTGCSTPTAYAEEYNGSLAASQEISAPHANPFDSECVLHSAIQRAALLRENSNSSKQPLTQQPPSLLKQGRRASLGGGSLQHNSGRRSSLSTSLHISALHNSAGIARQQQQQQQSLRASSYIPRETDEEMV